MRRLLKTVYTLGFLLISLSPFALAQSDTLFQKPPIDSLQSALQIRQANFPLTYRDSLPKAKKKLKLPLFVENNRLKLRLKVPLRKEINVTFPKVIYAGKTPPYDPKVAWQRSMIIPGWGQYYNRAFWKTPIIYGGYGVAGFLLVSSQQNYKDFQRAYRIRIQRDQLGLEISAVDSLFLTSNEDYETATADRLKSRRDLFRRNRDYYVLLTIGYHFIWVLEAYIQAHLKDLDITEELTMKVSPGILKDPFGNDTFGVIPGATVSFTF